MVDGDDVILQVNVLDGKSTEFGDSHSRVEKDVECLVVFAVHIIVMYKFEELVHLFLGNSFSGHTVIDHHASQLKSKLIFIQDIVIYCHLECRS